MRRPLCRTSAAGSASSPPKLNGARSEHDRNSNYQRCLGGADCHLAGRYHSARSARTGPGAPAPPDGSATGASRFSTNLRGRGGAVDRTLDKLCRAIAPDQADGPQSEFTRILGAAIFDQMPTERALLFERWLSHVAVAAEELGPDATPEASWRVPRRWRSAQRRRRSGQGRDNGEQFLMATSAAMAHPVPRQWWAYGQR